MTTAASSGAALGGRAVRRDRALDNLKVALVAAVIVGHGLLGYAGIEGLWPYDSVAETTLSSASVVLLFALAGPVAFFLMALMFLVAGLFTPSSIDRKGPARFARDRLLRLGVPFVVFVLGLWPALLYAVDGSVGAWSGSYWAFVRAIWPDSGPLWFVGVLLLASLAYAVWRWARPVPRRPAPAIGVRGLALLAVAVAVGSFLVRLRYPYAGQGPLDLNQFQWPECFALFGLGIAAGRHGWRDGVPERVSRAARRVTAAAGATLAVVVAVSMLVGVPPDDFAGGLHWPAAAFAALGGPLTVFGSVWLLDLAQRRLDRPWPHGDALARSAYGAFVLQGIPLLWTAVALRPVPVAAEVKALVVAVVGVVGSFALSWGLITWTPLRRVL